VLLVLPSKSLDGRVIERPHESHKDSPADTIFWYSNIDMDIAHLFSKATFKTSKSKKNKYLSFYINNFFKKQPLMQSAKNNTLKRQNPKQIDLVIPS
jgi:hypothetical protein